jgi:hypothetical protein
MNATLAAHKSDASVVSKRRRLNPKSAGDIQLAFDEFLDANLFGQDAGKALLRQAYINYRNPLRDKKKPIGFLILAGESRSGKTETARLIPRFVHGDDEAMLKINCSEYMDKYKLANLIGSPRGYIGNQIAGKEEYDKVPEDKKHGYAEFTNHNLRWARKGSSEPITVVLLDEWEKACYEMNLLLLQIMDDGFLTNGAGEQVDFRNCLFVATTNIGMEEVENQEKGGIGFSSVGKRLSALEIENIINEQIRKRTPPEFRNRVKELGGIAIYKRLDEAQMHLVLDRDLYMLQKSIYDTGYHFTLQVSDAAKAELLRLALVNNGNLSNLKSVFNTHLRSVLGVETIKGSIKRGDLVIVDVEPSAEIADELSFFFELGEPLEDAVFSYEEGNGAHSTYSGTAASVDDKAAGEESIEASLYQLGSLLGLNSRKMVVVALGQKAIDGKSGYLLADQLASLGLMPQLSSVFTDLHNLTMQNAAASLKAQAERFPELMAEFIIELKEEHSHLRLAERSHEVVQELTNFLGVEFLQTNLVHKKPYIFSARIKALPASLAYAKLRFKELVIRAVDTGAK